MNARDEVEAAAAAVQQHFEKIQTIIGKPSTDLVGQSLGSGDALLLALQQDNSWENFLLVHDELAQLLMTQLNRDGIAPALRDELINLLAAFHSIKRVIQLFISDNVSVFASETGQIM